MRIFKFIVCLLFGLMFINSGLNKLFNYLPVPEMSEQLIRVNQAFQTITWLMPLVAIIEIIGGILFIIPKTRPLGAIVIFPIMVGIICHHAFFARESILFAAVFLIINLWIIIDNKSKYYALINNKGHA